MKYLLPVGGIEESDFGYLTTPGHVAIPIGIIRGYPWAADNEAFTKEFDPPKYFKWLEGLIPYRSTCLFVSCPDVVGDAFQTRKLFEYYQPLFDGWPIAYVAQDGQENLAFPDWELWQTLFIGGTTSWKDGPGAVECIHRAMAMGKHIHIGRVNEWKRYNKFAQLEKGYKQFTCDGTKSRYIGIKRTIKRFRSYHERVLRQDELWT